MKETIHTQCVVSGGGPAGIMLGYLLSRNGIDVVVLEKWPDFFRDFRGDTIHPSTMRALEELELLEDFLKLPHSEMSRMKFHFGENEVTIADFTKLSKVKPFIAFVPQWDFLDFLSTKAKEFGSFRLMMETEVTDFLIENGEKTGVLAKQKDNEFEINADYIVGADGRHSTLREKGDFVVDELGVPIDVLWFRISQEGIDKRESLGYMNKGHALIMLDRHDYWQCAYVIPKGEFDNIKKEGLEKFRETVSQVGHISEKCVSEIDSWNKVKLLSVSVDHVRKWAIENVLLIGDAAHAMSPIGGVGINYAIQDAIATANILVPAIKESRRPVDVLGHVQRRREAPTRRMQKVQIFLQNNLISPMLDPSKVTKMPLVFKLLEWFPVLRRIPTRIIGIGFQTEHID